MDLRTIGAEIVRHRDIIHIILDSLEPSDLQQGMLPIKASLLNGDLKPTVLANAGGFVENYNIDFIGGAILLEGLIDAKQLGPINLQYKVIIQEFRFDQTGHKLYGTFQETATSAGNFAQKLAVKTALLNGPLLKTAANLSKTKLLHVDGNNLFLDLDSIDYIKNLSESHALQLVSVKDSKITFSFI